VLDKAPARRPSMPLSWPIAVSWMKNNHCIKEDPPSKLLATWPFHLEPRRQFTWSKGTPSIRFSDLAWSRLSKPFSPRKYCNWETRKEVTREEQRRSEQPAGEPAQALSVLPEERTRTGGMLQCFKRKNDKAHVTMSRANPSTLKEKRPATRSTPPTTPPTSRTPDLLRYVRGRIFKIGSEGFPSSGPPEILQLCSTNVCCFDRYNKHFHDHCCCFSQTGNL